MTRSARIAAMGLIAAAAVWLTQRPAEAAWQGYTGGGQPGTEHFIIVYRTEDYSPADYPPSSPYAARSKITPQLLRAFAQWLETSHDRYKEMGFRPPQARTYRGRYVVRIVDLDNKNRKGYCDRRKRILNLNAEALWETRTAADGKRVFVMQFTIAHELFHLVQYAYDLGEDRWLFEATAQWAANEVFPRNEWVLPYEKLFLERPQYPLHLVDRARDVTGDIHTITGHGRPYGSSLFIRYLAAHPPGGGQGPPIATNRDWGPLLVSRVLEQCQARPGANSLEALISVVGGGSSGWGQQVNRPVPGLRTVGPRGVRAAGVTSGQAAYEAGLRDGDVIQKFGDTLVRNREHLRALIRAARPGQRVALHVRRGTHAGTVYVTLGSRTVDGKTIAYLGVTSRDLPAPPPQPAPPPSAATRSVTAVFGTSALAQTRQFRELYDRFAVACLLGADAKPDIALPDAAELARLRGKSRLAEGYFLQPLWEAHYKDRFRGASTAALRIEFNGTVQPNRLGDDPDGLIQKRERVRIAGKGLDPAAGDAQVALRFSQPIEKGDRPICRFDGTEVNLTPQGDGSVWTGTIPSGRFAGGAREHRLVVNGRARQPGSSAYLVLDNEPLTIAAPGGRDGRWSGYEDAAPGMVVALSGEEQAKLRIRQSRLITNPVSGRLVIGEVENIGDFHAERVRIALNSPPIPPGPLGFLAAADLFSRRSPLAPGDVAPFTIRLPASAGAVEDYTLDPTGVRSGGTTAPGALKIRDVVLKLNWRRHYGTLNYTPVCQITLAIENVGDKPTDGPAPWPQLSNSKTVWCVATFYDPQGRISGYTKFGSVKVLKPGDSTAINRPVSADLADPTFASYRLYAESENGLTCTELAQPGLVALAVRDLKTVKEPGESDRKTLTIKMTGQIHNVGQATLTDPFVTVEMVSENLKASDYASKGLGRTLPPGGSLPFELRWQDKSDRFPHLSKPLAGGTLAP